MRSNSTLLLPALLLGLVAGSGEAVAAPKASAIPTQDIYADNGEVKTVTGAVHFAVVGDTRDAIAADKVNGRFSIDGAEQAIVADLMARVDEYRLKFAVLLGNMVTTSSTGEWKNFNRDWQGALAGSQLSEAGGTRLKSLPVCGTSDRTGDEWLTGFGAAFPGVGADIGANRVASWYSVDIRRECQSSPPSRRSGYLVFWCGVNVVAGTQGVRALPSVGPALPRCRRHACLTLNLGVCVFLCLCMPACAGAVMRQSAVATETVSGRPSTAQCRGATKTRPADTTRS